MGVVGDSVEKCYWFIMMFRFDERLVEASSPPRDVKFWFVVLVMARLIWALEASLEMRFRADESPAPNEDVNLCC